MLEIRGTRFEIAPVAGAVKQALRVAGDVFALEVAVTAAQLRDLSQWLRGEANKIEDKETNRG